MTPAEKITALADIFDKALKIAIKKGHDYSGTVDGMGNFRNFGWKGIVVRLDDKMQRLIQFCKQGKLEVATESVEDTLLDLINYAALTLIMYREENQPDVTTEKTPDPAWEELCRDKVEAAKEVNRQKNDAARKTLDAILSNCKQDSIASFLDELSAARKQPFPASIFFRSARGL